MNECKTDNANDDRGRQSRFKKAEAKRPIYDLLSSVGNGNLS